MSLIPVSDALKDLLDRKGMRSGTVGAVTKREDKRAGAPIGSDPQLAADQGGHQPIRLAWSNPAAIAKGVTKRAPFPMIEGGR